MKIVTYTTNPANLGFMLLKASCALNGLQLVALTQREETYSSFRCKDPALLGYLDELDDAEIILFTDAFDTIMMTGEDEILEKYRRFGKPLVFSAETRSWPDDEMANLYPKLDDSPHRYLNSGGFIGRADAIRSLLRQEARDIPDEFAFSNQYVWARRYLENQDTIALDTRCDLFYPIYPAPGEDINTRFLDQNDYIDFVIRKRRWFAATFDIRDGRIVHRVTGARPCNAHFNGHGKCMMDTRIMQMVLSRIPGSELYSEKDVTPAAPEMAAAAS